MEPDDLVRRLVELAARAARAKRGHGSVARFLLDLDGETRRLGGEIAAGSYRPGRGHAFRIQDPKPRLIYALPFRDRVAQHLLVAESLPLIERRLVAQTYACRTGKGTHRCLRAAVGWARTRRFVLRLDVRRFFPSIDHAILRRLLDRVTPPPWRWLRDLFLDDPVVAERAGFHFPGDDLFTPSQRPHGLPIGSVTSQIWANLYLAPIDHLITSLLGIGSYLRYCDDLLLFDDDPGRLREALAAIDDAATKLRLRLHPGKSRLHRTTDDVAFLGFVLSRRGDGVRVRLRHDNVVRMRGRMALAKALYSAGAIDLQDVRSRVHAWLAHARHGHTRGLLRAELDRLRF